MTTTNITFISAFIKRLVPIAKKELFKAEEITSQTFQAQREAYREANRLSSIDASFEENPDLISPSSIKLISNLDRAKFEFLTTPDFVKLTDEDNTALLVDAAFDEIKLALQQGLITKDDLQVLSNYYTSCTSMLLQRIETNVNEGGPKEPLKLFVNRARRCADTATFLNCLIETVKR